MKFRGGMSELLRQASRMQRRVEEVREEMKAKTVETSVADGKVTVVANGGREIVSIKIDRSVVNPDDIALLEDLVVAGANAALAKATAMADQEVEKATGGVKMPGL